MKLQHIAMAASTAVCVASGCAMNGDGGVVGSPHKPTSTASYSARVGGEYFQPHTKDGVLVMRFFDHSFSASCYDTLKCRVLYNGSYVTNEEKPSGPFTDAARKNLTGGWGNLDFPSVASVVWTSTDGKEHDEKVDLGHIFRSKTIRYTSDLDVNGVDLGVYNPSPDIVLIVEYRSIHVYMKTLIRLLEPTDPSNRYSDARVDIVLAYTHDF